MTAIAAGDLHNLALKSDGTVVAWGFNNDGQSTIPTGLSGVTAIAAGLSNSLAIYTPDSTPPTIAFVNRTAPNQAGWNNGPVTVQWSCSDAASGATSVGVSQTLSTDGANQSATGTCTDNAGNSASNTQTGINIDTSAPTLAPVVSPSPVRVGQGASASPNATDVLSGIASQSCGALDTSSAGTRSVSCTATDNAGNSASVSVSYTVLPAVPTTSVLDTFDRANGKVGSNWQGLSGSTFYRIASNKLDVQLGGPMVWKSAFGASQEAFVTLSTLDTTSPSTGLLMKVQDSGRAEAGGILVGYDAKAKKVRVSAIRLGAREWTLYLNQAATFANGDVLRARAKADGTVEVYQNSTLIASVTLNAADKAFFNTKGGKIGLWALAAPKAYFDDFGGGTVAP